MHAPLFSHQLLSIASIALSIIGFIPYGLGIWRGKVKPHLFSWMIWTVVTGMITVAQFFAGGGPGVWATAMVSLLCFITLIASISYGEKSRSGFDWLCLGLALLAIPLWLLCKTPTCSVIWLTVVECIAFGPMVRKTIKAPYAESLSYFILAVFKYLLAALALDSFTLDTALYPLATAAMAAGFIIIMMVCRARHTFRLADLAEVSNLILPGADLADEEATSV